MLAARQIGNWLGGLRAPTTTIASTLNHDSRLFPD